MACISFKSIIFVKKHILPFTSVQQQNSDQEQNSRVMFSFFEGTPRP